MKKIAFVFPGQGSQFLKMSQDFDSYPSYIKEASIILGEDLDHILSFDQDKLNQTKYTQPLIVLASIIAYQDIKALGYDCDVVAGFSLGEYSAYYAAELFDFKEILTIVKKRALYMDEATKTTKGSMAAIIGLDKEMVETICTSCSSAHSFVQIANYNNYTQTVISGHEENVEKAINLAKEKGAKLTKKLNVSGAFHSKLMQSASKQFESFLTKHITIHPPTKKMYLNTTAKPLISNELLKEMVHQIKEPVLFYQMIEKMILDGITHFIEIGPGQVLSGLIKKINKDVYVTSIQSKQDLNRLEQIYET
jgi:[acyl-carrier-protein] S-malonyltransferase